ncbi:MAG: SDR family oxidoreductase [Novosphingobium sp.]|nr:SDR family oxidoreductase [Novosphingobium sp.]
MTGNTAPTAAFNEAPVALVIGCGGLGMSVARAIGKHHPLVVVDVDGKRLAEAVDALALEGYVASGFICDITDTAQTKALGDHLASRPGVRALVHVAAVGKSVGSWQRMMEIDLFGACHVVDAVGPSMVRGSAAVLISSLASYLPPADATVNALLDEPLREGFLEDLEKFHGSAPDFDWTYNYAKLGINKLAERTAIAWGEKEARALSLSPGMIDSPMARAEGDTLPAHDGSEARKTRAEKAMEIPLRREGRILEITNVIEFLVSDGASFLNGIDITVDGGHRAVWRRDGITQR